MAIVYLYREPDDNTIPDPTQLADTRVRLYTLSVTQNAEEGSIGTSSILIDDPDGTLDIVGHRIVAVKETLVTGSEPFVFLGYVAEKKVRRGPYRNGVGRQWEVQVVDINTILERRIMTGSDANRPAETDVQRVQWLEATNEGHIINDTRYLFGGSPAISMDKVDYRGQSFKSVLDDCAQASGKNYYLTHFADTGATSKYPWGVISLWYGRASRSEYVSTIALSNDLSEIDMATTFALSNDTELTRDPSRVYSGIYGIYDGGSVYTPDGDTASSFARRDVVSPMENVKTSTRASARALRMLGDIDTEEDVITTTVHAVPAAQVNDLRQGMRVNVTATHLPGYENPQSMRVLNRTVIQESELTYALRMELSSQGPASVPSEGDFLIMFMSGGDSGFTDLSVNPWIRAFTTGNIGATSVIGCGAGPPNHVAMSMYYRAIVPGESAIVASFRGQSATTCGAWVYQVSGCSMSGISSTNSNQFIADAGTVSVTTTAAASSVLFGGIAWARVGYDGGWCPGGLRAVNVAVAVTGTQLVNKSSQNECIGGTNEPWNFIAYDTGTGSLSLSATATAAGAGSGAYNCGFNAGKGALIIPVVSTFGITQSAHAVGLAGDTANVTLPSPP